MTDEQENFYRHSTVIVDETKDSFLNLLEFYLTNQGITLQRFIEINIHEIYHQCYNRYPCCQCAPGTRPHTKGSRILHPPQLEILLNPAGIKLLGHYPGSVSAPHCCCPVNPNLLLQDLDFSLARFLLVNFTTLVQPGSLERTALDCLVNSRNHSFAHAKEGKISNSEYKKSICEIEKALIVLAKVYGKEVETQQRLRYIAKQPLSTAICLQFQNTLLLQCRLEETIRRLLEEKTLPEYLTKDLENIKVVEGCDARLELWTTEGDVNVEWYKGDSRILASDKYVVETSFEMHSLVVTKTDLFDRGIYTANIQGYKRSARLDIEEYFTQNIKTTMECIEGDDVELSCAVLEDNVQAVWDKDGVCIQQSHKYRIKDMGKSHMLSIIQPDFQDAGNYSVKVNNRIRLTSLQIREYFTQNMDKTIECIEGDNVELSCTVIEDNVLAVWKKDDVIVQPSGKFKIVVLGMTHKLSIISADLHDAGMYSVVVNNKLRSTSLKVKEIPAAVQQLSEKDKALYLEIIKAETEMRYYIRIVIIGENGVGKTSLLRRLLGEPIDDVESTDGIDIVHRCKIRLSDGQWLVDAVSDKRKAILSRIRRAVNSKTSEYVHNQTKMYSQKDQYKTPENASIQAESKYENGATSEEASIKKKMYSQSGTYIADRKNKRQNKPRKHTKRRKNIQHKEEYIEKAKEVTRPNSHNEREGDIDIEAPSLHVLKSDDILSQFNSLEVRGNQTEIKLEKVLTETVLSELSNFLKDIEKVEISDEILVDCGFWDFAGQRQYYPTHSIFLNPNAVHLLVANIMKDIEQIKTEDGYDNIGEYVDYWFDSIHSCRDMENKKENSVDNLNPPVIVVCTGIDNCKDNLENKNKQFCRGLNSLLDKEEKQKHLRRICLVSNTEPSGTDFDHLRQSIFEFGKELKTFGEILPLKWIRLERSLDILREAGVNILSWPDITVLSSKCSIDDENEIILFLKYQHQVGSIIYFENLKENIILNQKWLANAFRCLVSDKFDSNIALTSEWKMLEDTGKLEPVLIEKLFQKDPQLEYNKHQKHLLNVMELFGIIVKLTTLLEDGQKQSSSTYYLPCMISKQISIVEINKVFSVEKENCKRTPWLCIEFAFMPLDFFNQILCCYLNQYTICTEPSTTRLAIYHGMGIFDLDNTGLRKFILCFSKNTIAVQLWQWKEVEKANFQTIMEELKAVIQGVKDKYEPRKVSYVIKLKCSDGNIHNPVGRLSYKELVELGDDTEYLCRDNTKCHNTRDFFQTWFADYSETNFLTEEKRIDNDSELHNSIKATISLCSEKNERVARLDSTTNITPISHKEYDKAYYMESLGCDKSGNRDSDPDDYRNKEMRTFREQEYDEMIVLTSPNNLLLENNSAKLKTQKVKNSEKSMNKAKSSNDHALTRRLNNNNKDTKLSLLNELDLAQNDFRFTDFEPWKKEPEFTVVGKKKKKLPTAKEVIMTMKESLLPPKPMKREEKKTK